MLIISAIDGVAAVEVVVVSFESLTGLSVGNFSYSGLTDGNKSVVNVTNGCIVVTMGCVLIRSAKQSKFQIKISFHFD